MKDKRKYLKVKLKSLAAEARIIRLEEKRTRDPALRAGLGCHRVTIVRSEARHTLLAYGFIRGRPYEAMEPKCRKPVNWDKVKKMVQKYGVCWHHTGEGWEEWPVFNARKKEEAERFEKWYTTTKKSE